MKWKYKDEVIDSLHIPSSIPYGPQLGPGWAKVGPSWAPVGLRWAPIGPQLGPTGAQLGMLLGMLTE